MTTTDTTQEPVRRVVHVIKHEGGFWYQVTPRDAVPDYTGWVDRWHGPYTDAHALGDAIKAAFPKAKEQE